MKRQEGFFDISRPYLPFDSYYSLGLGSRNESNAEMKECIKGPTICAFSFTNTSGTYNTFKGVYNFANPLKSVVAFRVISMSFILKNNTGGSSTLPTILYTLKSNALASNLTRNPFRVGTSTSVAPSGTVDAESDIIAISKLANAIGYTTNSIIQNAHQVNQKLKFYAPTDISYFDWSLQPLNGDFSFTNDYSIEFMIEFYHKCNCG